MSTQNGCSLATFFNVFQKAKIYKQIPNKHGGDGKRWPLIPFSFLAPWPSRPPAIETPPRQSVFANIYISVDRHLYNVHAGTCTSAQDTYLVRAKPTTTNTHTPAHTTPMQCTATSFPSKPNYLESLKSSF